MSGRARRRGRARLPWLSMTVAAAGSAALTATLFGVQATAVLPRPPAAAAAGLEAATGTLDLRLGDRGAGFEQVVSGLVPGDVVHRYVVLRNAGTLAGHRPSLRVRADAAGPLTADGASTRAVRASVTLCRGGMWSSSGRCGGTATVLVPPLPLAALAADHPLGLPALLPGATLSLRVTLQLPDQDERVVNGRLPQESVQGQRTSLTWTFRQQQGLPR